MVRRKNLKGLLVVGVLIGLLSGYVTSFIVPTDVAVVAVAKNGQAVGGFFDGYGRILLHMLVSGFLGMVVCAFLKFTGRGDVVPLVAFVCGGVILYEVMGLFQAIYARASVFLNM